MSLMLSVTTLIPATAYLCIVPQGPVNTGPIQ